MLRKLLSLSLIVFGWAFSSTGIHAADRPNILMLFADDFTYEAIGSLGLTDIETPNLDRLARRGTRFSHASNMGSWSGAVCIASRCMLMTGKSVWHAEKIYDSADKERIAGRFWPQHLQAAGYRTYFSGKWHLKANPEKSFDVVRHVRAGMPKDDESAYLRPKSPTDNSWRADDPALGGYWEGGKHWSEVAADDAIDYLKAAEAHPQQPAFFYIAFNAPHDPRQSPTEYLAKYPLERILVPASYQAEYPFAASIGCGKDLRDERLAPFPRTEHAIKTHRREYYALITHLDAQIGRILDQLDQSGAAEHTLVIFTADHGLSIGHHGLLGKQNQYDVSTRVPFLIAGPGIPSGKVIDDPIYLQDAMPTSLAAAGAKITDDIEFQNLFPLLTGSGKTALLKACMDRT